ncbi:MAG TPA: maleylpyruvate isomerase N-terminal domain-containing protein [Mycobacteriales bacterium]|nr:maleylpyruvate isomerase N-terminal domain-containing protein [Mycobacteriales bacterium]
MVQTPGRGLSSGSLDELGDRMVAAWDSFVDLADNVDLAAPSRLPGWRGHEVLVHLGSWDESSPLATAVLSARSGGAGAPYDPDAANAALVEKHRDATRSEVLDALRRSRDRAAELRDSRDLRDLATEPTMSSLGPLPFAGLVHAGCYELAVHALDLRPCGAPEPDADLLDAGLAALIDVTGALAARQGIVASVVAQTPAGGWRMAVDATSWSTYRTAPGKVDGPAVLGSATDILDASAGRAMAPVLLVQRRLVVQEMTQFLKLAPLVEQVPGIPGAALLRRAAGAVGGVTSVLGRLRGR